MARRANINQLSLFGPPPVTEEEKGGDASERKRTRRPRSDVAGAADCTSAKAPKKNGKTDVFDEELAERERDIGIARVEASTDEWQQEALTTIREIAQRQQAVTTDDVWLELGRDEIIEGRAMGAAMKMAAKLGYIRRTDTTQKSLRVACHRRDIRIWESLLCR